MDPGPPEKRLQMAPFTIHATRGLLRDPRVRRTMMAISIVLAVSLLVAGFTFLRPWLDPHEHPLRFILFWLACAWQTILAVLLALFDLLMVRQEARAARKALRDAAESALSPPEQ